VRASAGLTIDTEGRVGVQGRAAQVLALGRGTTLALEPIGIGGGVYLDGAGFFSIDTGGGVAREEGEIPFSACLKVRMRWDWRDDKGPEARYGPGLSVAAGAHLADKGDPGRGHVHDLGPALDAFLLFDRDNLRELPMIASFYLGAMYQWLLFNDFQGA
jgi:hypothetical protein